MPPSGNTYADWKASLAHEDAALPAAWNAPQRTGPLSASELSLELKGLGTLALAGMGLLILSSVFLLLNANHLMHGERTTGTVVGHKERYHRRSGRSYAPVVDYTVGGEEYRIVGQASSGLRAYPLDQEVAVLYLPDDPANGVIADFMQLYLAATICGVLGTLCLGGAGGLGAYVIRKSGWRLLPG